MKSKQNRDGVFYRLGVFLLVSSAFVSGCNRHPKATTRESMDFIKQVYTACNTKNSKRLASCEVRLAELESDGKISREEIASFKRVLEIAAKGEWESAQTIALKYAQDQVR
jgi:predicted component of type VI protein secretion system